MKPVDLFTRDVHTFWATTYQFDLKLFDQFLLRRLGQEPLDAVVLCDEDDLTETLGQLTEVDRFVAANANRRYVLRGMRVPSGGRFHPKTYLFASRRRTILLVGSGNLTRSGLDRGAETFVTFDADEEDDLPVFRAWAAWIGSLVDARGDEVLGARYRHLRTTLPILSGFTDQSVFLTSADRALADVILERRPEGVTELLVSAPYFDEHAGALADLIERAAPSEAVRVYLGARPSVDGSALRQVLASAGCRVSVHRVEPERFVHAKLIGLVGPDDGLLVCGSANLSRAALARTYEQPGSRGNCEVVVLRRGTADEVRSVFRPPDSELIEIELDQVEHFRYEPSGASVNVSEIRLLSASIDASRQVCLRTASDLRAGARLMHDDAEEPLALAPADRGATTGPLFDDLDPLLAWVVDESSTQPISNIVAVDDPRALEAMLGERAAGHDRPPELREDDERSDLVALLAWANRQFIFDLDDTKAIQRARQSTESEAADPTDFWERYVREELTYDPRSQSYRPLTPGGRSAGNDLLLREIEAMLHAAPHERRLRLVRGGAADPAEPGGAGHPWSLGARQRLRARNVIRRWARSLPDPRHAWLGTEAPARNYEALIELLALIWLGGGLGHDQVLELLGEIWTGLLGTDSRKGLIDRADPDLRDLVLASVHSDVRELAAGMAYAALAPPGWGAFIYDWQRFLVRGIERKLLATGDLSCAFAEAVLGENVDADGISELLSHRAAYIDDERWGHRIAADLGLANVRFVEHAGFLNVRVVVAVDGLADPAHDPRIIVVARRAMSLKKSDHVLVQAGDARYLLRLGSVARAKIGATMHASIAPIDEIRLEAVEQNGGTLADLLGIAAA